jgi:hypothetical protein
MAASPEQLAKLRRQLAERFPTAQRAPGRLLRTGIPAIDDASGGLPVAAITEIVCPPPSSGGQLLLQQLLAITRQARQRVALIDSHDSFDPCSFPEDELAHLLWVRCPGTGAALQAADLLARDANLALVVLDLRCAGDAEFRRIPGPQWYRLQRAVESTDLALVVKTPRPAVPSAQVRFALGAAPTLADLGRERPELAAALTATLQRQRLSTSAAG